MQVQDGGGFGQFRVPAGDCFGEALRCFILVNIVGTEARDDHLGNARRRKRLDLFCGEDGAAAPSRAASSAARRRTRTRCTRRLRMAWAR